MVPAMFELAFLNFDTDTILRNLALLGFLALSVILILTVLIQKPQGGGLSGAFGAASAGSGQTAFGAKTGDALTVLTVVAFVAWLAMAITMVFISRPPEAVAPGSDDAEQATTEPSGAGGDPSLDPGVDADGAAGGAATEAQPRTIEATPIDPPIVFPTPEQSQPDTETEPVAPAGPDLPPPSGEPDPDAPSDPGGG
ncbi:MAG: preprotein translocase subunit SecG [Planctomycetota bacterium]